MSRKVRPLETRGASRCTTNRRGTKVSVLHFAARPTQPADALTSENRLKGVALDRLHRRLIDAPANNNPRGPARSTSSFPIHLLLAPSRISDNTLRALSAGRYPRQHYRAYAARCNQPSSSSPRPSPLLRLLHRAGTKKFRESTCARERPRLS